MTKVEQARKDVKVKSVIDFDSQSSSSIKSVAIKKNSTV